MWRRKPMFDLILTANHNYQQLFDNSPLSNRASSDNDVLNGRYGFGTLIDIVGLSSDIENTDYIISIMIIYLPIIVRKAHPPSSILRFFSRRIGGIPFFRGREESSIRFRGRGKILKKKRKFRDGMDRSGKQ